MNNHGSPPVVLYIEGKVVYLKTALSVFSFILEEVRHKHMSARFIAVEEDLEHKGEEADMYWLDADYIIEHPEFFLPPKEVN